MLRILIKQKGDKVALDQPENEDVEPTTPVITDNILKNQPKTEDPHEIDLGDDEMGGDDES